jgi:hypothetical protein
MTFKIDQIAFYCLTAEAEERVKQGLGLLDRPWIRDTVTARSRVKAHNGNWLQVYSQRAELQFNYDLGIEVEILRYIEGASWLDHGIFAGLVGPHISHIGAHIQHDFPECAFPLVQETWTESHTSDFLTNPNSEGYGRRYHYRIHQIGPATYLKFIKRVPKE